MRYTHIWSYDHVLYKGGAHSGAGAGFRVNVRVMAGAGFRARALVRALVRALMRALVRVLVSGRNTADMAYECTGRRPPSCPPSVIIGLGLRLGLGLGSGSVLIGTGLALLVQLIPPSISPNLSA